VFNLLGPLTNPAGAKYQLVGVFDQRWLRPLAEVFQALGSIHTLVVCSDDGTDEISLAADTRVAELRGGAITGYQISPTDFGIEKQSLDTIIVRDADHSLAMIREALSGAPGPAFDMVALNAGATLYAADIAESIAAGVELAREVMRSGKAMAKLEQLVEFTARFKEAS
jgi:anthranilate phosphoribosyltransferase